MKFTAIIVVIFSLFSSAFAVYAYLAQNNIPIRRDWVGSLNECVNQGMILATPDTTAKNDELKAFLSTHSLGFTHIAANDLLVEAKFEWMTTGQPVTNTAVWHTGEPNNGGTNANEDCALMSLCNLGYGWYDKLCTSQSAVVCQAEAAEVVALAKSRIPMILDAYEKKYGVRASIDEEVNSQITIVY